MTQYRYEAHIVLGSVWDEVKIGGQYLGGEVVDGISGMGDDLVLVVSFPTNAAFEKATDITEDMWGNNMGREIL